MTTTNSSPDREIGIWITVMSQVRWRLRIVSDIVHGPNGSCHVNMAGLMKNGNIPFDTTAKREAIRAGWTEADGKWTKDGREGDLWRHCSCHLQRRHHGRNTDGFLEPKPRCWESAAKARGEWPADDETEAVDLGTWQGQDGFPYLYRVKSRNLEVSPGGVGAWAPSSNVVEGTGFVRGLLSLGMRPACAVSLEAANKAGWLKVDGEWADVAQAPEIQTEKLKSKPKTPYQIAKSALHAACDDAFKKGREHERRKIDQAQRIPCVLKRLMEVDIKDPISTSGSEMPPHSERAATALLIALVAEAKRSGLDLSALADRMAGVPF